MFDVMFSIASGQPDPNLLPLYDQNFRPRELILFVTEEMQFKAQDFVSAIKDALPKKATADIVKVSGEKDINEFRKKIEEKINTYLSENKSIVFNLTGGTKIMSIAAFSVYKKYSEHITAIYLNINDNKFTVFKGFNGDDFIYAEEDLNIRKNFDFKTYFGARGIDLEVLDDELKIPTAIKEAFYNKILDPSVTSQDFMSFFNSLCKGAILDKKYRKDSGKKPLVLYEADKTTCAKLEDIFKDLSDYVSVIRERDDNTNKVCLIWKNTSNGAPHAKYFAGGWMEDYCYKLVKEIVGSNNVLKNVRIERKKERVISDPNGSPNELDVCFFYNSTLHVIEVKTVSFKPKKSNTPTNEDHSTRKDNQDYIHKLISIGTDLGLKTKLALVSFNKITDSLEKRAQEKKIKVFSDDQVKDPKIFRENLKKWIKS